MVNEILEEELTTNKAQLIDPGHRMLFSRDAINPSLGA